jgi:hypothetical protein
MEAFAALLKSYGVLRIGGDRYAGEWPREQFRKHGITYEPSEMAKSDLYRELLPLLNSGRVELLDHGRLVAQLCDLERRTARGGRDSIDHSPGAHDDIANAVAGVLVSCASSGTGLWQREALAAVPMPSRADVIYGVLVTDKHGHAGIAHFARLRGSGICLLDVEQAPLSPPLLHGVVARLFELAAACPASRKALYATSGLSEALERLGYRAEIIDRIVKDELLAVSAASHVAEGRVRLCADVLSKNYPLSFMNGAALQDDGDPLRLAFLAGVALALDSGRRLGRAQA